MKVLKFIAIILAILCFSPHAFAAAISSEKQEIIKEYYFTEAVNIAAGFALAFMTRSRRRKLPTCAIMAGRLCRLN